MKKFWIRTASSVVYVALFLGTMFSEHLLKNELAGTLVFLAFMLFVACGCTFEFYRIAKMKGVRPIEWLGYVMVVGIIATFSFWQYWNINGVFSRNIYSELYFKMSEIFEHVLLYSVLFGLPLAAISQLWRKTDNPCGDIGYALVPILYVALPLGLMIFLQKVNPYSLLTVVVLVWINDACAYMLGSLFGRHKMWARHSPGKTWEGTISGVAIAMIAGTCVAAFMPHRFLYIGNQGDFSWVEPEFAWWHGALLGLICGVIGTLGDLVESMLKRSVGLKDSGKILPGHGGFLDRFDSLLILMPFATVLLMKISELAIK